MGLQALLVQRASIHNGLDAPFAAEDDEQIADHGRLALLVEFDDAFAADLVERHLDHADRALDDLLARGDDEL